MSRTYKDRPYKVRFPEENQYETFEYIAVHIDFWTKEPREYIRKGSIKLAGVLLKKSRRVDTENHWMNTPSWWTHMFMTRPERTRANRIVKQIKRIALDQLDLVDIPDNRKKPHLYYW